MGILSNLSLGDLIKNELIEGAAADGGGGAGSTAGWRGKASVLILPIGARACEPVGVAAA